MAIETQTNFVIQASASIDSRYVVSDISARNGIEYKYAGLKTYVLSEGVTYVYGTDSEWKVDGGSSNVGGGNGIYGGSGSIPGDVSIFLGTVSNNLNNRSNYLYYETDGLTDGDKNYLYNYSFRNQNGQDWNTMAYRTEQKLIPFGLSVKQGPFIEYGGVNPMISTRKSVLNLGVGNNQDFTTKVVRVSITPITTEFYSTQNPISENESPVAIHKLGGDTYFGYNTSGDPTTDNYTFDDAVPTYRMKFGLGLGANLAEWNFDTKVADSSTYNTIIKIETIAEPNAVSSNLKFLVDTSSRDWDTSSARLTSLLTPQQIIRDVEHRYTKIQMLNVGTLNKLDNGTLFLNTEGNSFEIILKPDTKIADIKAWKSFLNQPDFPNGTIINIKFINEDPTKPGYIVLYNGSGASKIKSDISDANFEANDNSRLTINHGVGVANTNNGDVITFRKFNTSVNNEIKDWWEIVNVNKARKITTRNWTTSNTDWTFTNSVKYLSATSTLGNYIPFDSGAITSPFSSQGTPPNKWPLPTSGSTIQQTRESVNSTGFSFRMSVDGNRIVFVQGNFRIDIKDSIVRNTLNSNIRKLFYTSIDDKINIWWLGKITNTNLIPQWETAWTPVRTYTTGRVTGSDFRIEIIDPIFTINRLGDMFLTFEAESPYNSNLQNLVQGMLFEVYVPPFSYTAATGSFK